MMEEPFVIIAKPVGSRCNMRCQYCYYIEKGQYSSHVKQSRMSYDLLEKLIKQTIEGNPGSIVSFTWHGGEPMLAGKEFYQKVVELEKKYLPKGCKAWNNLQTNGLLMNDAWAKFLKENHFDVGISIDGDELVHDAHRKDLGGQGTYRRVQAAIHTLKHVGIEPDLLCTVNAESIKDPLQVYRSLREFDTGWIQFIPIVVPLKDGGFSKESITPEGYGRFLCTVFDEWVSHDLGRLDVQLFAEVARIMAGGKASLCWMSETCGRVLIAEEDGSIYACDHFVDDEHRLGNLKKDKLKTLANSSRQIDFGNSKKNNLSELCKACPYLKFCGGGCLKDRYASSDRYYLCDGLKMFFDYAIPVLTNIMELSKAGKKPKQIMDILNNPS